MTSPGVVQSNNALKIFKTKFIPTLVYKKFPDPRQCMKICKISHQVPQSLNLSKKAAFHSQEPKKRDMQSSNRPVWELQTGVSPMQIPGMCET